jgi:Ca2+-binding RTX toxin-like protein
MGSLIFTNYNEGRDGVDLLSSRQFSSLLRYDKSELGEGGWISASPDRIEIYDSYGETLVFKGFNLEVVSDDRFTTMVSGFINEVSASDEDDPVSGWRWSGADISVSSWSQLTGERNWSALDELLFGTSDVLLLTAGADDVRGFGGNDRLKGYAGSDRLFGGDGNDTLLGGNGGDSLMGGEGRDRLTGGPGSDDFVFNKTAETGRTRTTRDVITDFELGVDDMDLSAIDANIRAGAIGNQAFTFIGGDAFAGVAGQLRFAAGVVSGDVNGDGKADFQIAVIGILSLAEGDFVL